MTLSRRGFLGGIIAAGVAPLIVRAGILMPIKPQIIFAEYHLPAIGPLRNVRAVKHEWAVDDSGSSASAFQECYERALLEVRA